MKALLLVLFIFVSTCFAQNPDGQKVSLHLTTFVNTGNFSISSGSFNPGNRSYNFDGKLSYKFLIKIPFNKITFSPFLEYDYLSYGYSDINQIRSDFKFKTFKIGGTISFYFE
jgi:hypothetical protein